jgi:hypothetical protein
MALSKIDVANMLTGTAPVANGGTGVTTAAALANTGNLVLLSSQTASNDTTINFDNTLITDTYNTYKLIGREIVHGTDSTGSQIKLSIDNGSNFLNAKSNRMFNHSSHSSNTVGSRHGTSENFLSAGYSVGTASAENGNIEIDFLNLRSSLNKHITFHYSYTSDSNTAVLVVGNKEIYNTSQVNYIQYRSDSGNVASGKFSLYGVKT